ncbi:MAG TPA: hypothetical protein VIH22_09405 [Cyclobacteriaceae bacterium]|jgi:hypothetical protein
MENGQTLQAQTLPGEVVQSPKNAKFANILSVIILIAFVALIIYMMTKLASDETYWTRALYLFGSVEAIAFAAAGYVFGRQVSREQINKAEDQAERANNNARNARQAASEHQHEADVSVTKLNSIVAVVRAEADSLGATVHTGEASDIRRQQGPDIQAALERLARTVEAIGR